MSLSEGEDAVDKRLLEIAATHCKLALEALNWHTTPQRKVDIRLTIELLRIERDVLMNFMRRKD